MREAGCRTEGALQFTVSPVHSDAFFFAEAARQFVALGIDALIVKDAGGLLTPDRVRTLLPALRAVTGDVPIYCHSHCVTGLGPAANLVAVEEGVSAIWTASTPLANGASLPADQAMVRNLQSAGFTTTLDPEPLADIAAYWTATAQRFNKPTGTVAEYDHRHYIHQMPGGMIVTFRRQLEDIRMADRLDEVLEEMPRVRAEFGYPNSQTPFSQFIGTQALLNVLHGRYEIVPDEVRNFVLGYFGRTLAPVDPNVLAKVGRGQEPVTGRPSALVPPILDWVRREHGPFRTDEDLLLADLFMPEAIAEVRRAQRERVQRGPVSMETAGWLSGLVRQVAQIRDIKHVHVSYL